VDGHRASYGDDEQHGVQYFINFQRVLGIVKTCVLRRTDFGVNEQYPEIINRRRQALVPKMHEERRKDNRTFINYDKLYINGV
jgi:hypothetical protein